MFNNKKLGIRLVAILMTLLMTVAIFAGCNSKQFEADIDAAQSEAEAANAAAAAANAAAQSAADAAAALAAQLAAAQAAADSAKAAADSALKAAQNAQSGVNSIANGTQPVVTGNITEQKQKEVTDYINTTVLGELSQLKVKYLTVRYLWYTDAYYNRLAKLFDDAYIDVYRATTIDGVKGVISKLTTDIIAIPSIITEADAIQSQIKAFGEVDYELFLSHESNVTKARTDYTTLLNKYKNYFFANALYVDEYATNAQMRDRIDTFVLKNLNIATTTIRYAESKIVTLKAFEGQVEQAAFDAVKAVTVWGKTTYSDIKTESAKIEAAYALYKIFLTANGGDSSSVKFTETTGDKRVLTGEQFVKQYVLILYDGWFTTYKQKASDLVNSLVNFFMNETAGAAGGNFSDYDLKYLGLYTDAAFNATNYTVTIGDPVEKYGKGDQMIRNEYQIIAALNSAEFLKWTYSGSFKGTYSLEDAYLQVDNYVTKTITEMATVYFNRIALPALKADYEALKAAVTSYAAGTKSGTTSVVGVDLKDYDKNFAKRYNAAVDAFSAAAVANITTKTYDQLKATTNIEDLRVLNVTIDANDVTTTFNGAAMEAVLIELNKTIKETADTFAKDKADLADSIKFYDFSVELVKQLDTFNGLVNETSDTFVKNINTANKTAGATSDIKAPKDAADSAVKDFAKAVLALDYKSYSATTYQATNSKGEALYYNAAALDKAETTTNGLYRIPLMIELDKMVIAKDASVTLFGQYADKIFKALTDLARANLNKYIDTSVALYNTNYASDATTNTLNIKTDIDNYLTYLKTLSAITAVTTFDKAAFSLENDTITGADGLTPKTLDKLNIDLGYKVEVVKANEYMFHVQDYKYSAAEIYNKASDTATYLVSATTLLDNYCNLQNVYTTIGNVRLLAYYKDQAIINLNSILASVKGTWDATKGDWVAGKTPTPTYDYYSSRKVMYLSEVDKVYNRLVDAIMKVTMLDEGVTTLDSAKAIVDEISARNNKPQDGKKASESKDDYSFTVAYARYYAIDGSVYNWAAYNAQ